MLHDFTKDRFDVIIQAGQSNSVGGGKGKTDHPLLEDWGLEENIWYMNPDFTICTAEERVWGNEPIGDFSLSFGRRYVEAGMLASGRKLLVIRAGEGGTGFSDGRWGVGQDLRLRLEEMIRTARELNRENRFLCFLWHQGETDATEGASLETHYHNLAGLVNQVRELAGEPELPFLTAGFVPEWVEEGVGTVESVLQAIKQLCQDSPYSKFVEADGLLSNAQAGADLADHIHFCRDSLCQLGDRLFEAYRELRKCPSPVSGKGE